MAITNPYFNRTEFACKCGGGGAKDSQHLAGTTAERISTCARNRHVGTNERNQRGHHDHT
ncbi:MAG: hypothetical protein ACU84J_01860 [Gammaproteobacteria bacterium]